MCLGCAGWSGHECPQHPPPRLGLPAEPQECPVLLAGDVWALTPLVRPLKSGGWSSPELGIPHLHLSPTFSFDVCSSQVCRRAPRCGWGG